MAEKQIVVKFDVKTGECEVEVFGFKGSGCEQATKFLRDTLGTVSDFEKKNEYWENTLEITGTLKTNICG